MTRVAVCVPVLDDRDGVAEVLPRLHRALADVPHAVCVVDDGSRDGTLAWLDAWAAEAPHRHVLRRVKTLPGCRRGGATRDGMRWLLANTDADVFVDLDADGAQPPEEIPAALAWLDDHPGSDVVVASKYAPGAVVTGRPLARRLGSRAYSLLLRAAVGTALRDWSNSFRTYRRRAASLVAKADTRYDTPAFLLEMLAVWVSAGLRVDELPTRYEERRAGRSKVGWRDAARGLAGAADVVRGLRAGRYRT